MFKYGGIYIDVDTISIRPLGHHLRNSFVAYSRSWHNVANSIFGFPQVSESRITQLLELSQGSSFLKFVLEAAKLHFAEENYEKLKVPQQFGPTFFTTTLVSVGKKKC